MKVSAILVAAGGSRRMGFDKLLADLAGECVLVRSLLVLEACPGITGIRVVTSQDKFDLLDEAARRLRLGKYLGAIEGGAERHLSVQAGLARLGPGSDLVAVHDAARPLVTPAAVSRCIATAAACGAAALAHRVTDTLKRANPADEVVEAVSRDDLWAMETPQVFSTGLLLAAYDAVLRRGEAVTDEVSAVAATGHPVRLVENTDPNLKITVPGDLAVAAAILREREQASAP